MHCGRVTGESYLAIAEEDELPAEADGFANVVGDEEDGFAEGEDEVLKFAAQDGVEGGKRLVEKQHGRVARKRAGEGYTLLLTAAELMRVTVEERGFEAERLGECFDAKGVIMEAGNLPAGGEVREEAEVLLHESKCAAELKGVVSGNRFVVVSDVTRRGEQELVDEAEQCALAATTAAEDGRGCIRGKAERDPAQDLATATGDMYCAEFNHDALRSGRWIEKVVLPGTESKRMSPSCRRMMR